MQFYNCVTALSQEKKVLFKFPLAYRHSISLGKLQNSAFVMLFDQTLNNTGSYEN